MASVLHSATSPEDIAGIDRPEFDLLQKRKEIRTFLACENRIYSANSSFFETSRINITGLRIPSQ